MNICSNEQPNTICTRNTGDKNCQAEKSVMWPVKPATDCHQMDQQYQYRIRCQRSQKVPQGDDKNCQSTKYYGSMCADKKCQATKFYKKVNKKCQTSDMWPVKPQMDMQSKKPAM